MNRLVASGVVASAGLALAACATPVAPSATCRASAAPTTIAAGEARIQVRTVGEGAPVLMIPSLARGAGDFDALAAALATRGRMAILAEPRGIGGSTGPAPKTLGDLADDAAAVIAALCDGPVDVVGHAFGQRVTRMLAARHPARVRQVVLLAAGGRVPMPADVRADLIVSLSQGVEPDGRRRAALAHVFFARGQNPDVWLDGWTPEAATAQGAATQATPIEDWWGGGDAPMLVVQASEDPIAPRANGEALAAEFGARITLVALPHASHAMLPEQPDAVAAVVDSYFSGERDATALQSIVDRHIKTPDGRP